MVRLQKLGGGNNVICAKLEGDNPAGSVKDRPALNMIIRAAARVGGHNVISNRATA